MKHSLNSINSSHKFVYTSKDKRYLCWKSVHKEDEKRISLLSISLVIKEGVEFYIKGDNIQNINSCLVIISDEKKLQFECGSEVEALYLKYEV